MPTGPSTWYNGPLPSQQLNVDLYSYDGSGYGANGILFHAHRPLMHEQMTVSRTLTVSTTGTMNVLQGGGTPATLAFNMVDTGALFGLGSEYPGPFAVYHFVAQAVAASGVNSTPGFSAPQSSTVGTIVPAGAGGAYLTAHFVSGNSATTTPAAIGTGMYMTPGVGPSIFQAQGTLQPLSTNNAGCAYYIDLINTGGGAQGSLASPAPLEPIASLFIPQGNNWVANWVVSLGPSTGTAATNEANNFALTLNGNTVATSTNAGTIGSFTQTPFTVATSTGEFLQVTCGTATPTDSVIYSAALYGNGLPTIGNDLTWQPAAFIADGSATTKALICNQVDTCGFTPRNTWLWAGVTYQGSLIAANSNPYNAGGSAEGWDATNATVVASDLPGWPSPQPFGVLVTADGSSSTAYAYAPNFTAAAGTVYQITSTFYMNQTYNGELGVDWYDGGTYLSTSKISAPPSIGAGQWTPETIWATAPSTTTLGVPWAGLNSNGGGAIPSTISTFLSGLLAVGTTPAPQVNWSGPLTTGLMNGPSGPQQALQLLNNPPLLRAIQGLTTSITTATATTPVMSNDMSLAPAIDSYNAFNNATSGYRIPLAGLYLFFATFPFASNTTGQRWAGFKVVTTTGATLTIQGPASTPVTTGGVTSVSTHKMLDLNAGDIVFPLCFQNSGGNLALSVGTTYPYTSRFGGMFLAPFTNSGVQAFTPPQTAFHWFAGIPAANLATFLNEHLGNDLNFLVNRPYFTGYQTTAQSGFNNTAWSPVTINKIAGLVHGSGGDNYGGWSTSLNAYVAQQPGWYLVFSETFASFPSGTTGSVAAGIYISSSGGVTPTTSPDQYQTLFFPSTTGQTPGVAAIGCYYLNAGEYVQPVVRGFNWNTSWGTAVSNSGNLINSQFNVIWVAE